MKIKRVVWDDSKTKQEILKRFKNASDVRRALEDQWIVNEQSVYSTSDSAVTSSINSSLESALQVGMASVDG